MKRYWKLFSVLSLVLLMGVVLVGPASADTLRGKGWLRAQGSGVAILRMTGEVEINGHGPGMVYILGAEEIHAEGDGIRNDLAGGGVVFRGHKGTINISGEKMVVRMVGTKIDFTAHGKGTAVLRGHGRYHTKGGSGDWQPDGLTREVVEE